MKKAGSMNLFFTSMQVIVYDWFLKEVFEYTRVVPKVY
jgi:hypothetical protein